MILWRRRSPEKVWHGEMRQELQQALPSWLPQLHPPGATSLSFSPPASPRLCVGHPGLMYVWLELTGRGSLEQEELFVLMASA